MKKGIIIGLSVAALIAAGYYFVVRPKLRKENEAAEDAMPSTGKLNPDEYPNKTGAQRELNALAKSYKNSVRTIDSLRIPFFRNFYVVLYDNNRFFFGRLPQGIIQENKGSWKNGGQFMAMDNGKVLREKTIQDNLAIVKKWIITSDLLKDVDECKNGSCDLEDLRQKYLGDEEYKKYVALKFISNNL